MFKLELDIDYQTWRQYFLLIDKPNLLQSWCYGEAKKKCQGWKIRRGIIYEAGKPIALFQVLYKSFLLFKLVRLNFGPLWLVENPSEETVRHVLGILKQQWNLRKRCVLLAAPNLNKTSLTHDILSSLGFYKRSGHYLVSGWVDLRLSESDLRTKLRGNWRNQLKVSEKHELKFITSQDASDFQWLMSEYAHYQKAKTFQGTPIALLQALYECSTDFHDIWIAYVVHNNERVAGMLVAYYGNVCTLLVSWVSEKGRELNAGNFILWNFILYSKALGCVRFDQGGIDEKNNAAVAKFKRGIPCEEYELIGEYFAGI